MFVLFPLKFEFATDSPLEGAGFEPSVPLAKGLPSAERGGGLSEIGKGRGASGSLSRAELEVRIQFPPAESLRTFGSSSRSR